MAEKNSLWKNIRKKAEQNRRTGATPKKPTKEMLRQERKIKAKKYQDGGPVKTDRYGNPIDAKVEVNPNYINSEYDPRTNTIYLGQDYNDLDDYWKSKILAHENYHAFQFNDGYSTELPYDVPYKKPAMPTTDDEFYGYHNRKINESFRGIDKFKKDSEFQFVPDEVVFDKVVNENLYNNPTTLEGEARNYERSGEFTSEENFLKTLEQQKAKGGYMYADGGAIIDPRGQWAHPGKRTIVPSPTGQITMQDVPYPVYGEDETGYGQIMYPNNDYQFPGQMIDETPIKMQAGGPMKPTIYNFGERAWPLGFRRGFIDFPGIGVDNGEIDPTTQWALDNWNKLPLDKQNELVKISKKDFGTKFENAVNAFAPLLFTAGTAFFTNKAYEFARDPKNKPLINRFKREILDPSRLFRNIGDLFNKESEFTFAKGGSTNNHEDDVFKSSLNVGKEFSKPVADFYTTWMNSDETIRRFDELFPALPSVADKVLYDPNVLPEVLSERNIYNIERKIPGFEKSIANTKVLYNPDPVINQELINKYIANLNPKYKEEVLKSMKKNPQGFTDPEGNIIVLNPDVNATDKYDPLSIVTHEGGHTYEIETKDGKKPLAKIMMAKFPTPEDNSVINELEREELYPFLMQLRFDQKFKPGEIITPERLQEIKKSGYNNHLFRYYNNEVLSKILNTLASNKQQSPYEQYAAKGGYLYQDGGDINLGKQKAVASTTAVNIKPLPQKAIEDFNRYVSRIPLSPTKIIDNRVYNPVTKTKIKPTRDLLSGEYDTNVINNIVKYSKEYGVDPYLALAVGLQETQLGKTDSNIGHVMDLLNEDSNAERSLVSTLKDKMDYAKKLGYKDTKHLIQAYNGLGTITPETEKKYHGFKMKSIYGVPIPKEGINMSKTPLYGEKIQNIVDSVLKQNPNIVNIVNTEKAQGGHINPYMYYAGGPMEYKRGGFMEGLEDVGKLLVNTVAAPIEQISGNNFVNWNYNNKWASDAAAVSEGIIGAATDVAGSVLLPGVYGQAKGAIQGVTKNIGNSTEYQRGANKWANTTGQISSSVGDLTAGIMGGDAKQIVSGSGQLLSTIGGETGSKELSILGQAAGVGSMFINPSKATSSTSNLPILPDTGIPTESIVNQGLSFAANGGPVNNNLLTLQNTNTMKDRYIKYRQQQMAQGGIYKISEEAGTHDENAYGGVPIGKNAKVEGGEYIIPLADGNQYVISANKNGELSDGGIAKEYERKIKRGSPLRPQEQKDSQNKESIAQATNAAIQENERQLAESKMKEQQDEIMKTAALQYAAAGGKISKDIAKIVEEEYAAAYGGYINPKKYKGLNMPYSSGGKLPKEVLRARVESHMSPQEADAYVKQYGEGGSIHIKESKKGTFTAAAKKHGMDVQKFARQVLANKGNYSLEMVQKANFAKNASEWKHAEGGYNEPPYRAPNPYVNSAAMGINYDPNNIRVNSSFNQGDLEDDQNDYSRYMTASTAIGNVNPSRTYEIQKTKSNYLNDTDDYTRYNSNPKGQAQIKKRIMVSGPFDNTASYSNFQPDPMMQNFLDKRVDYLSGRMAEEQSEGGYTYNPMIQPMLANGGPSDPPDSNEFNELQKQLLNKYRFELEPYDIRPDRTEAQGYDYWLNRLKKEGLTSTEAKTIMNVMKNPLEKENKPITQWVPEYDDYNEDFFDATRDPSEFDLYTGSLDTANIRKYRPTKKLEARKPFGYGQEEYAQGGIVGPNVSNVNQPFSIYGQNRGGMGIEYADGGFRPSSDITGDPGAFQNYTRAGDQFAIGGYYVDPPDNKEGGLTDEELDALLENKKYKRRLARQNRQNNKWFNRNFKKFDGANYQPPDPGDPTVEGGYADPNNPWSDKNQSENTSGPEQSTNDKGLGMTLGRGLGLAGAVTSLGAAAHQFFQPPLKDYSFAKNTYNELDPTTALSSARDEYQKAMASSKYALRNAPTSGSYMSNVRAMYGQLGEKAAKTQADIMRAYAEKNMENRMRTGERNTQIQNQEIVAKQMDEANRRQQKTEALYNLASNLSGIGSDFQSYEIDRDVIGPNIGTNNWRYDKRWRSKYKQGNQNVT
jgi:hypothetical protein